MEYRQFKGDAKKVSLEGNLRNHEEQHFLRTLDLLKWRNLLEAEGVDQTEIPAQIAQAEKDIARLESICETIRGELDALAATAPKAAGRTPATPAAAN